MGWPVGFGGGKPTSMVVEETMDPTDPGAAIPAPTSGRSLVSRVAGSVGVELEPVSVDGWDAMG